MKPHIISRCKLLFVSSFTKSCRSWESLRTRYKFRRSKTPATTREKNHRVVANHNLTHQSQWHYIYCNRRIYAMCKSLLSRVYIYIYIHTYIYIYTHYIKHNLRAELIKPTLLLYRLPVQQIYYAIIISDNSYYS